MISWAMLRSFSRFCVVFSSLLTGCGRFMGIMTGDGAAGLTTVIDPTVCPGVLLNADEMESDITRYLPSLIEEMAYITTKKANSRVMKSA